MSLISVIATDKFISFMSDGRMSDGDKAVGENYKKINKINEKVILGITGNLVVSQILNERINQFDTTNAKTLASSMFSELGNHKVNKDMHIIIGGLDDKGEIFYTGFSQFSDELIEVYPKFNNIPFDFATTEIDIEGEISNQERLGMLIKPNIQHILKLKGAKAIQEKLNAQVSMIDRSVNTKTFHEYIKK